MNAARRNGIGISAWLKWSVLALLVAIAQPAWAVRCVTNDGGATLTEAIGNVPLYTEDAPDGYVIWVSPPRTTTGYCYKDLAGYMNTFDDPIYFYANPGYLNPAHWGLEIGIRYNGHDYFGKNSQPGNGVQTGVTVPICASDADVLNGKCPHKAISITYQIVVRKQGKWQTPPSDTYAAFQFDGKLGLNGINPSFRYSLSGMNNLKPTPCLIDVTVTPEPGVVQFGQVTASGNGFSPAIPRKQFSLLLKKQCDNPVKIDGYFETSQTVQGDGLLVPSADSNFGIGIESSDGTPIKFNKQFTLANMAGDVPQQSVPFNAVLKAFGPPKTGPFTGTATIRLFLY